MNAPCHFLNCFVSSARAFRFGIALAVLTGLTSTILAEDFPEDALPLKKSSPAAQEKEQESETESPSAESKPEAKSGETSEEKEALPKPKPKRADEALFRKLTGGEGSGDPAEDPFARLNQAVEKMRKAREQLEKQDVGESTTGLQEEAIRDLEKLLELARQQNRQPQGGSGQPQPQQDRQPQQQPGQQPDQSQDGSGQTPKPNESDGQPGKSGNENAEDSDESIREAEKREAAELQARRESMVDEAWGHLPPRLRERILNINSDKYLSRYAPEIRRYFEALAKQPAE